MACIKPIELHGTWLGTRAEKNLLIELNFLGLACYYYGRLFCDCGCSSTKVTHAFFCLSLARGALPSFEVVLKGVCYLN